MGMQATLAIPLGLAPVVIRDRDRDWVASRRAGEEECAWKEEREWVTGAAQGDAAAFRALVDRYRDRVLALAWRMVGEAQLAEEVAQDSFVRAWQALPRFRGESRFSTWLYRITVRRAYDARMAMNRRRGHELEVEPSALDRLATVEDEPGSARLRLRLEHLLSELPETSRAVLTLFYVADQSITDIAGVLGLPAGTVKTHLFRSREALRKSWTGRGLREDDIA
jgi:RNA polymerase sigma-70 factor (ECF subfamily)